MKSQPTSVAAAESQSDPPTPRRLVIRIKLPSNAPPQAPVPRRLSRGALVLILGAVALLLSWVGISMFGADAPPAHAATTAAPSLKPLSPPPVPAPSAAAPVVSVAPAATEPETREVIPDVSRGARETIRGTIRVSIRVIVDQQGAVVAASTDEPGPSRYFERLALEAAKQWTFAPADSARQRIMLVRFYYKRSGTTARVQSLR